MTEMTLEEKRAKLGNLLGDGPELRKTGIAGIDAATGGLMERKGRAFTTLVLLSLRTKLDIEVQRRQGVSEEDIDTSASLQSLMMVTLAQECEYDMHEVIAEADGLLEKAAQAVRDEQEAGDPNGTLAQARSALDARIG